MNNLSMCREAIPLAGRFRPREVLPEGTRIAQVIYLQFLRLKAAPSRGGGRIYEGVQKDDAGRIPGMKEEFDR